MTGYGRAWRTAAARRVRIALSAAALAGACLLALAARDRWTAPDWRVSVPVAGGTVSVPAALALRAATTATGTALLAGRGLDSPVGRLSFEREPRGGRLVVRCQPCLLPAGARGEAPTGVPEASVTVARAGDALAGELRIGTLVLPWRGALRDDRLDVEFELAPVPLAEALAPFAAAVPELAGARVTGTVSVRGRAHWPGGDVRLEPALADVGVSGLGTARLARPVAVRGCRATPAVGRGPAWQRLGAAVVAAEDPGFYEHPGYALAEARFSLGGQADAPAPPPPAGTLSEQLARLVYSGGGRDFATGLRTFLYAVEMEQTLGKARILDLYLAMAPWGSGGCGAQTAARAMYARPLEALSLADTARLAAGRRDDVAWRDVAAAARVLRAMRGITRSERQDAIAVLCTGSVTAECVARPLTAAR
jgi:hypothetical protein